MNEKRQMQIGDMPPSSMPISEVLNQDEIDMAKCGKRQQLKRNFRFWSLLGFACAIMITWEGLLTVFVSGLENGGPAGLIYGFLFCWAGYFAVVASMAELVSMMPTSGGQYHWTFVLAPPHCAKFLSYLVGWCLLLSWIAIMLSASFLCGTMVQGLVVLNYPSYTPHAWHGTLLLYSILFTSLIFNTFLARFIPILEKGVLFVHLLGLLAILVPLVALGPHSSASEVFTTFENGGDWQTQPLSFFIGLIATIFAFLGADSGVHMSEEMANASIEIPRTMILSIIINGVLGFSMLVAILFCMGDINSALTSPTGYPFIEIFVQAVDNRHGGTAMVSLVICICVVSTISCATTASRIMWAFARDRGLPGSRWLAHVDPKTTLPLWSIFISTLVAVLLGMLNFFSTAAFSAFISLSVSSLLITYFLPLWLILYKRLFSPGKILWGPFKLGKAGIFLNVSGLVWIVIATFFSFWPVTRMVEAKDMNWSSLFFGAVIIFSLVFYWGYGRKGYKGPVIEVDTAGVLRPE